MDDKSDTLQKFFDYIGENYDDLVKIYHKYCMLSHLNYSEETFHETILKVSNIILKKNLKDTTPDGIANYFFKAFKFNTLQDRLQTTKRAEKFDTETDVFQLKRETPQYDYEETELQKIEEAKHKCFELIRANFSESDYIIFRLKHNFLKDDKELTYKEIKHLIGIQNVRQRLIRMHQFLRAKKNEILK